jgi:hypothetical protein
VLRPIGILPNNANIEVVVLPDLQDISGQSNSGDPSFDPVFATFRTISAPEPQFDALIEEFDSTALLDFEAPVLEPFAEVTGGKLRSTLAFDGSETPLIYQPETDVVLSTDSTVVTPVGAPPRTVNGGVFRFAEVIIPAGIDVQGVGPNPMVWIVRDQIRIEGTITVDGRDGATAVGSGVADIPLAGGVGGAGGGRGGNGSPSTTTRSLSGQPGFGPDGEPNVGGDGGNLSFFASCRRGSGGGGGSFSTEGDPYYPPGTAEQIPIVFGGGDVGCLNTATLLIGGSAGDRPFVDSRGDNDFWGAGVNIASRVRIQGELTGPRGGSGGGAGGDEDPSGDGTVDSPAFTADRRGGAGGGGGGVLIIQCLGRILITESGRVSANGGNGNAGDVGPAGIGGFPTGGGGGGGGSGGMVVLMSAQGIDIVAHGGTYTNGDFNFAVSADGGVSLQGPVTNSPVTSKYFSTPNPLATAQWTQRSSPGGFGGLGLVQLMAPPGNNADGTNTVLDDNINFYANNTDADARVNAFTGAQKQSLIGWRGWRTGLGSNAAGVDDSGTVFNLNRAAGDIRPNPILLPAPFGGLSRARSRWVDLGQAPRTASPALNGEGQVVVIPGEDPPGPDFELPGLGSTSLFGDVSSDGYLRYEISGVRAVPKLDIAATGGVTPGSIAAVDEILGVPAFTLTPSAPLTDVAEDRYSNYRLRLLDAQSSSLGEYRILQHTTDRIDFAQDGGTLPAGATSFEIVARFVSVRTGDVADFGATYVPSPGVRAPLQNVRIGFAFTTNPIGGDRWPADQDEFEHNLDLATNRPFADWLQANRPRFVQYDVLFNRRFIPDASVDNVNSELAVDLALPPQEIDYLVLPYRF